MAIKKPRDPQQPTTLTLHNAVTWPLHTVRGSEGRSHEAVPGSSERRKTWILEIWDAQFGPKKALAQKKLQGSETRLETWNCRRSNSVDTRFKTSNRYKFQSVRAFQQIIRMSLWKCTAVVSCLLRFYRNSIIRNFTNCTNLDIFFDGFRGSALRRSAHEGHTTEALCLRGSLGGTFQRSTQSLMTSVHRSWNMSV